MSLETLDWRPAMLHAHVNCDCFEKGLVKSDPPHRELLYVGDDGFVEARSNDFGIQAEVYYWRENACQHERGVFLVHCIGNMALVSDLRTELTRQANIFPILLGKVLYNGIHGGDFLTLSEVLDAKEELEELKGFESRDPKMKSHIESFRNKLSELVECSLVLRKPIVF